MLQFMRQTASNKPVGGRGIISTACTLPRIKVATLIRKPGKDLSLMFRIEERLGERGISIDDMVVAAMALYVPHGMDAGSAAGAIREKIRKYLGDPNIASLMLGAILLEEEIFGSTDPEIQGDPVFLLSDEIIGMAIAECIGGTYARFEFTRYDQKKPGVLSELGPFLDDAVAGLIAGCTSRLYSECC